MTDETETTEQAPCVAMPPAETAREADTLAPNPPTTETAEPLTLETQRGAKGRREAAFPSFRFMALGYALLVVMIFSLMASYSEWFAVYKGAAELKALALLSGLGMVAIWINVNWRGALVEPLPWEVRFSSIIEQAIYITAQMIALTFISGALIMGVWAPKITYIHGGLWGVVKDTFPNGLENPALGLLVVSAVLVCALLTLIATTLAGLHNVAVTRSLSLSASTAGFAPPRENALAQSQYADENQGHLTGLEE